MKIHLLFLAVLFFSPDRLHSSTIEEDISVIRINQLGYLPDAIKVAVFGSKNPSSVVQFSLHEATTGAEVYRSLRPEPKGSYGPFESTYRLNFSDFQKPGSYYLRSHQVQSPVFRISEDVYDHTADFLLEYMRQQRCGYNPYLTDSCHLDDGYILYNSAKMGQRIDVTGGWHDATDYLQYTATSANAIYQLLLSYRENPQAFGDAYRANGLPGSNGIPDIVEEAKWGMDWLIKMNPSPTEYYNQIADDRDHVGYRLPNRDSAVYDPQKRGRPVYLANGQKQGMLKYQNRSDGIASTAGKFASAFALGALVLNEFYPEYGSDLKKRAIDAYKYGEQNPGVSQTAPGSAPYFYEEENWVDDMELAAASLYVLTGEKTFLDNAQMYAAQEKVTPWIGRDTAVHYQFYPFLNAGHYELASNVSQNEREKIASYYGMGLEKLHIRGKKNPFFMGVPFVWCSNNYVTAAVTQCKMYYRLTADSTYLEMEAALRDWLFGCNIWGTSMIVGLPEYGDTPVDPHSSLLVVKGYQTDGGLVDGPVYGSIAQSLIGVVLHDPDEYADFQSDLVVYQDDIGSYSTNEPTMDGTASLVYYLSSLEAESMSRGRHKKHLTFDAYGNIIRGDQSSKKIHLMFSGDEYGDGVEIILGVLEKYGIEASFFLTGNFYRDARFAPFIKKAIEKGHYLGPHSDQHLLYNDWTTDKKRLVNQQEFKRDLQANYHEMEKHGIGKQEALYFLPPYEWNDEVITQWADQMKVIAINYSPGTLSHADYTTPAMQNYRSSDVIIDSIWKFEENSHLNGFMLLSHIGSHPDRTDKFYARLEDLVGTLLKKGYQFESLPDLLKLTK